MDTSVLSRVIGEALQAFNTESRFNEDDEGYPRLLRDGVISATAALNPEDFDQLIRELRQMKASISEFEVFESLDFSEIVIIAVIAAVTNILEQNNPDAVKEQSDRIDEFDTLQRESLPLVIQETSDE
jgi:hypothetical protein